MGIFDPATYGPSQGGLIDRLMASLGAPLQPGPGFPSSPMDANAAMPPQEPAQPQNAPIAYGNVMVPRIGSGFSPLPDGTLPRQSADERSAGVLPGNLPTAQPAAPPPSPETKNVASALANSGVLAALAPATPQQPQTENPLLRIAHGLHSISRGGSIYGAVTGNYDDPQSFAQAQQARAVQQQYLALKAAGVPDKYAVLAAINPEAAKSIVPQYVGPDKNKFLKIGQDGLGREQYGFVNEQDKTVTPANSPGASDTGAGLGDMNKTGAAYLATLPPAQRGTVQAMVEGRMAPPSSFALSKPYWQNMIAAAQNVDPTFDATNWSGRVAGVKDFASGKSAEMVRSANQTLQHVNALLDSADALHNGNYPALNWVGNKFNEATGGGEPGAFITNAHAVADEMSKVFKGGNLSDSEIRAWEENLSPNMSPAQQRAQIGKLSELLHGSLQALEEKRVASIGQAAADKAGPIIKPAGQAVLQRIDAWLKAGATGAGNTTKTGVKWSFE